MGRGVEVMVMGDGGLEGGGLRGVQKRCANLRVANKRRGFCELAAEEQQD